MTARGRFVFTLLILGVVGFGVYRWWDKLVPSPVSTTPSINPTEAKKAMEAAQPKPDVMGKLLAGGKDVSLIGESAIPQVAGVSDYDDPIKARDLFASGHSHVL